LIVLLTVMVAALGVYSLKRLPIDAVPDITNNQVQINAVAAPRLSPIEVEKQVDVPRSRTHSPASPAFSPRDRSRATASRR
jgi:Cu/Ag efflux pump CusA